MRAVRDLGQAIAQIKTPLQKEWEAYQKTPDEVLEMERKFEQIKQRLQNLQKNNASWRTQLTDGLRDIRNKVQDEFREEIVKICRQSEEYLDDSNMLANPEIIITRLEAHIDSIMSKLGELISKLAADLHGNIERLTELDINPFEDIYLSEEKAKSLIEAEKIQRSHWWDKTLNVSRNAGFQGTTGAALGSIVGGFAGGLIGALFGGIGAAPGSAIGQQFGAFFGGIAGLRTGASQALSQEKEKEKRQIWRLINQFIEDSQHLCNKSLNETMTNLERSMRDELTTKIQQEIETCDRTLRSIQESRKRSLEQIAHRKEELKAPLQQLRQLEKSVEQLAQNAISLSEVAATPQQPGTEKGDWANE